MHDSILSRSALFTTLESALMLDIPYLHRVERDLPHTSSFPPIRAAVLILFAFNRKTETSVTKDMPSILFIRRAENIENHSGQMAFPGGHHETVDLDDSYKTALRETEEEVGIPSHYVTPIGRLPDVLTATGYIIHPVVGVLSGDLEDFPLRLDPKEIADALWISVDCLWGKESYRCETFPVGLLEFPIDVYQVDDYRIWGATGSMTKNILDRIAALM